jgi:hypothetical protein
MRGNGLNYGDTWIEQHYVQRQREVEKDQGGIFQTNYK